MNRNLQKSPLVKASLSDQLIRILLEKMTYSPYTPGARIDIEELKKEFGVSHIPIRDALHKLAEQGLVRIVPRVGYFHVRFTPEEIRNLYDVRSLLETAAVGRGIRHIDKEALKHLEAEYRELRRRSGGTSGDIGKFYELSEMLHKDVIIKCSQNPLIENIYTGLINKIRIASRVVYLPQADTEEHLEIIRHLIDQNAAAAKKCLKAHLEAARNRALKEFSQSA